MTEINRKQVERFEELAAKVPGMLSEMQQAEAEYYEAKLDYNRARLTEGNNNEDGELSRKQQVSFEIDCAFSEKRSKLYRTMEEITGLRMMPTKDKVSEQFNRIVERRTASQNTMARLEKEREALFGKWQAAELKATLEPNRKGLQRRAASLCNKIMAIERRIIDETNFLHNVHREIAGFASKNRPAEFYDA